MKTTKKQIVKWLHRIQIAVDSIPAGQVDGGPSISVVGVVGFQRDMNEFRRHFTHFVWAMLYEDDEDDPEQYVKQIEALAERARESLRPPGKEGVGNG